jgi:hypothetical protein
MRPAGEERGEDFERLRYATHHTVELSPLPCWEDLTKDLQKKRIAEIAQEIEDETKVRLEEKGILPLGPDAIRRQSPETLPPRSKKSPAPLFLAASKRIRDDLRNAYYSFVAAFREAADQLKAGNRNALFPEGSFPPAMPFVSG